MRNVKKTIIVIAAVAALIGLISWCCAGGKISGVNRKKAYIYRRYGTGLWEPMPETKAGDWFSIREETGQTFKEYLKKIGRKKAGRKGVIYLQPLGEIDTKTEALFEIIREFTSIYFDRETRL